MPGIYKTASFTGLDLRCDWPPDSILGQGRIWDARQALVESGQISSLNESNGGTGQLTVSAATGASDGPAIASDSYGTYMSFNGTNQSLGTTFPAASAFTVAVIGRVRSLPTGNPYVAVGAATGANIIMGVTSDGKPRINAGSTVAPGTVITANTVYVWLATFAGTNSGMRVEGAGGTFVSAATGNAGSNSLGNLSLAQYLATNFAPWDIYRFTYWPTALSLSKFAAVCASQRAVVNGM